MPRGERVSWSGVTDYMKKRFPLESSTDEQAEAMNSLYNLKQNGRKDREYFEESYLLYIRLLCALLGYIMVPHVFAVRAWQLIAGVLNQGNLQLPPTAEQRAEASKLCKEISVSLKHTSPEVNATVSLAAHLGGFSDLVAANQRLVAQTEVLLHRGESQQRELEAAQSEVNHLHEDRQRVAEISHQATNAAWALLQEVGTDDVLTFFPSFGICYLPNYINMRNLVTRLYHSSNTPGPPANNDDDIFAAADDVRSNTPAPANNDEVMASNTPLAPRNRSKARTHREIVKVFGFKPMYLGATPSPGPSSATSAVSLFRLPRPKEVAYQRQWKETGRTPSWSPELLVLVNNEFPRDSEYHSHQEIADYVSCELHFLAHNPKKATRLTIAQVQ
ncbi:MAG: hypothetical protein LQ345_001977 [Seirophora villosa]|nr:MAG: hypothetical protein LQ345_001977 [Seirophora villosa]